MREAVIVIADLFIPPSTGVQRQLSLPGLGAMARFGAVAPLEQGWRPWLARWIGREDLAAAPVATVASTAVDLASTPREHSVWIATPVRLLPGISSVHVGGIVRLEPEACAQLARDFNSAFDGSGHRLHVLPPDNLILSSSLLTPTQTVEPARCVGSNAATSLAQGTGAAALLRLGSEIEMWLHTHPRNASQVSTLWLWGGGPVPEAHASASHEGSRTLVFGREPYVNGLQKITGATTRPFAGSLDESLGTEAERVVLVVEMWRLLSQAVRSLDEALIEIDRRAIAPARALADRGVIERLVVLANDRQVAYRGRDRLKKWRRTRPGLAALT